MPETLAIATSKRKFYKALDSFTNTSQTSITPSQSDKVTSAKRPATAAAAFDEARERATKRLRQSTSSSSLSSRVALPTAVKKDDTRSRVPPNFSPWSHEAFLAKLKTFSSVSLWHSKPEAISEVEWAKRGWVCVGVNTVACRGGCEKRSVVSLDLPKNAGTEDDDDDGEDDGSEFEQALVERYKDVIVNGHAGNCLWRKDGCKDDIYHVQVVRSSIWQPELRKRYQSALEIRNDIESVKLKPLDRTGSNFSTPERLLKDISHEVLGDSSAELEATARVNALEVALHGWRGSTESGSNLLHCDACFQRIGLWMYQTGYRPSQTYSDDEDTESETTIYLVEMHREHCPWRNPATQKASGSLSGFNASQVLQRVVSTYSRDQRRRSDLQSTTQSNEIDPPESTESTAAINSPLLSKEEVARQDKERESRLRKLKNLFNIKRRSTKSAPKADLRSRPKTAG